MRCCSALLIGWFAATAAAQVPPEKAIATFTASPGLEVSLWAPRGALSGGKSSRLVRIGRSTRASAPAGRISFAVGTDAKARSALRRHRRLSVTVSIALTPPGGHKLTRSVRSTLRAG